MRKTLLSILLTTPLLIFAQSGITFSSPIIVTTGNLNGYNRPRIVLDADNEPVVLWGNNTTKALNVSTFTGSGFTAPQQINPVGTTPYMATWYNADLKSAGNTLVAVYPTTPGGSGVYLVKSTDGGVTWSAATRVDNVPASNIAYYPSCAINGDGDVAVTFMRHDASWTNPRYVVTTSTDGGATFIPDVNASGQAGSAEVCDCCPAYMMYRNSEQVLLFRNNNANIREFYAAVSGDDGTTFDSINVDRQHWNLASCPSSAPAGMFYGDSLVSVFMSGAAVNNRVYISTSHIQDQQTGYTQMINASGPVNEIQNFPRIAGENDIMGLVWQSNLGGEQNIYFSFSKTGPKGLLGAGNIISTPALGVQQNPDIVYANGNFHIVYQDNQTKSIVYLKATLDEFIGIEEAEETSFSFYMDPSSSLLNVFLPADVPATAKVEIIDMKGAVLKTTEAGTGSCAIDMSGMAAGMYYIKVEGFKKAVKVMK